MTSVAEETKSRGREDVTRRGLPAPCREAFVPGAVITPRAGRSLSLPGTQAPSSPGRANAQVEPEEPKALISLPLLRGKDSATAEEKENKDLKSAAICHPEVMIFIPVGSSPNACVT